MKKQIRYFLLTILLAFVGLNFTCAHDFRVGGIYYKILSDGNSVEVTYNNTNNFIHTNSYSGTVIIPSTVTFQRRSYTVTRIGKFAFSGCSYLINVVIPNSITSIEDFAFESCSGLTSVEIPNSVTSIGDYEFYECSSLTSVKIPKSVKKIGDCAFYRCPYLTLVKLADGLTEDEARKLYAWNSNVKFRKSDLGQKESDKTPKFDPKAFPVLDINDIMFADNGNKKIDAFEQCSVKMKVTNSGKGAAVGCVAKIKIDGIVGLTAKDVKLPVIAPGKDIEVDIELLADGNIKDGIANISVSIDEPHGFGCDPTLLTVETKAFVAPKVLIADYSVTGTMGGTLEKRKPFDLQILVQNAAQGIADDVDVTISVPQNVFITDGDEKAHFTKLGSGETKSMVYQLIVNNNYSAATIPVSFTLREKHGKYAESKTINLALNQSFAQNKIEIKSKNNTPQRDITLAKIEGGVKQADVDLNIPQNAISSKNTFAVIIANENYKRETAVRFAANDGNVMRLYFTNTLGLPEQNVHIATDATLNEIRDQIEWIKQVDKAYNGEVNMILYYAGHGMPDEQTGNAYLVPVDGNSANISTCIALNKLYEALSSLKAKRITVFLDACFSGSQRGEGQLLAARGVSIKPKTEVLNGNLIVFSAAQGTETAYPYTEMGHGLFTYYLLKKLQETKGNVSLKELGDFVTEKVSQQSIVVNNKPQTPVVLVSGTIGDDWKKWTLK